MKRNHGPRRIWGILAMQRAARLLATGTTVAILALLPACASLESLGEAIDDSLPVSQGEMREAVDSVNDAVEGASSGNAWMAGAGGLGILGFGALVVRRMIKKAIGAYDDAPFQGPNGEEVNEEALVAAALGSKPKGRSSKS